MNEEKKVIEFYILANKLKNVIRSGWKIWKVKRERLESVAEHIYGVQMLAIAIYSQYKYDIDIKKVILMLAIHEIEEIYIGDLTQFEISINEKRKMGSEAVKKVLKNLLKKEELENLINEFEKKRNKRSNICPSLR